MADLTWKRSEIRDRFRELTGLSSTNDISDADVDALINDYYVNHFPADAQVDRFDMFFTQALSATDDGVYALSTDVDRLDDPVTINERQIEFFRDREIFFGSFHHHRHFLGGNFSGQFTHHHFFGQFTDEQYITDPTLVIGSSDSTKVKHSDFSYRIGDFSYSKSSSEVDLTGDAIPTGKYGAWSLKIDEDGTITVEEADDNGTGYDTPRKALDALDSSDSDSAYMGYVTVTKSDGAFTPATTALDASNVTATFTDGKFENRAEPTRALLFGSNLYVHPKPNDIYEFKAIQIADRPTAFSDDSSIPADTKWGPAIALGAANLHLSDKGEVDRIEELVAQTQYRFNRIRSDKIKRLLGGEVVRRF